MTLVQLLTLVASLFLGNLIVSLLLVPLVMRFARRVGAVDRGGYRKVFEGAMPLLGGLGVALPLLVIGVFTSIAGHYIVLNFAYFHTEYPGYFSTLMTIAQFRSDGIVLILGSLAILALGLVDDTRGMRARWKLLGQVVVASFVCVSGHGLTDVDIPLVGTLNLGVFFGGMLTVLWIVGMINAFNLIDGVDGLASGIALVGVLALVILSIIQGNLFVTFVGAALAGTLLGFLCFNFPPARIFLGDTGSMFIGYFLATMSLMGSPKYETAVILLTPMLALSFPIFETFISIIRRYLRGVPIFAGDNHHTHHRLLGKGYSQPQVVLTLYGVALSLATAAVLSALIPLNSPWSGIPYALYAGTLVYIAWLAGYLRPTTFRALFERRQKNRLFHALANYAKQCLDSHARSVERRLLLELCRHELGLRYIDVVLEGGINLMASEGGIRPAELAANSEKLRVKSTDEQDVFVYYAFIEEPSDNHRADVIACLAGIFDQTVIDHRANRAALGLGEAERVHGGSHGGEILPNTEPHSSS